MENNLEKTPGRISFESYQDYFNLTDDQLSKPLLDVGSNYGDFINYIRDNYNNENAFGIENQKNKTDIAGPFIINASGLDIPFEDESFDTVVAKNYLPMFLDNQENTKQSLNELIRVTKIGGIIKGDFSTPLDEDGNHMEMLSNDIDDPWYEVRKLNSIAFMDYVNNLSSVGLRTKIELKKLPNGKNVSILTIYK